LFWFGAAPPIFIIAFRLWLPETNAFQVMKAEREARLLQDNHSKVDHAKAAGFRAWVKESWIAIKENWVLFIYMVILMSFFNACSHGSQDFYPTFLKNRKLIW
jgi:SHS family lactate transporter-like MFS transporter